MENSPPILVYQDFVELTCNEDDGAFESSVSRADKYRNGIRFRAPRAKPGVSFIDTADELAAYLEEQQLSSLRRETFGADWTRLKVCPHCQSDIQVQTLTAEDLRALYAGACLRCGWWETEHILSEKFDSYGLRHGVKSFHRRAVLKSFSVASADVPVQNLCEYLARHPEKLENVDPGKLEELVGHVFRETHECEVAYVGGPNDRGIDLYLARGDQEMVVQVKRRALRRGAEPASSIREFVGAMVIQGAIRGIFVTSGGFSKAALREARDASKREPITSIELIDGGRLISMCELARPIAFRRFDYPESEIELNLSVYKEALGFPVRSPS